MVKNRVPYNSPYKPSKETIKFILWHTSYVKDTNKPAIAHLQLLDHIFSPGKFKGVECSRGLGKTSLVSVNTVIYSMIKGEYPGFGEFKYILLVSDTVSQAEGIVKYVDDVIDRDEETKKYLEVKRRKFGDDPFLEIYNKVLKKTFYYRGRGAGQKLRGINEKGQRPNIVICDDLENDELVENKETRKKLKRWFKRVLIPSVDISNYKFIYIGTPLHEDALLMNLKKSDKWEFISLPCCEKFPVSKDKFISAWEDRFTWEEMNNIRDAVLEDDGNDLDFKQEYLLMISDEKNMLYDLKKIHRFTVDEMSKTLAKLTYYIGVDLAVSEKESADYTAISVVGVNDNNDWFVVDGYFGRIKPDETINRIFNFVSIYKPYTVVLETVGFQASMKTWIEKEMVKRGKFFNITPVNRRKEKMYYFKALQPIVELNKFWVVKPPEVKYDFEDYMKEDKYQFAEELISEMSLITNNKILAKHDDILDSIAILTSIEMISTKTIDDDSRGISYNIINNLVF